MSGGHYTSQPSMKSSADRSGRKGWGSCSRKTGSWKSWSSSRESSEQEAQAQQVVEVEGGDRPL